MEMPSLWLTAHGLRLREWTSGDLAAMRELFDDPDVAYRTPLESPFDQAAARRYLDNAHRARKENKRLHLAITIDDQQPLGEVLLNQTTGSISYVVGGCPPRTTPGHQSRANHHPVRAHRPGPAAGDPGDRTRQSPQHRRRFRVLRCRGGNRRIAPLTAGLR